MKYLMNYNFKIFEQEKNKDYWNIILKNATYTHKIKQNLYLLDFDKIKLSIENGADVNFCNTLSWATRNNNFEIVKYMLENGADPDNCENVSGEWISLMSAACDGYVDIAKILIDYGANPFVGNFQDITTIDIIMPNKQTKDSVFGYENQSKYIQKKRDDILEYIIKNSIHYISKQYNL